MNFNDNIRGPGYFKINKSLLLETDYQNIIQKSINKTVLNNKNSNPNTLWEIIKGNIRNETIKYAAYKKKTDNENEHNLKSEIKNNEQTINSTTDTKQIEETKNNQMKINQN